MTASQLRQKYLDFFVKKGHKIIPNVSLIPENDPTALFISAGMHSLVPYLLGEQHPLGKRLCSVQKCLRTDDIDSVGDTYHHTFFEMLGNWSLGDYWKKEAIEWSFEFLTKELKLDKERIYISCFGGDEDAPRDSQSAKIWQEVGIPTEKIYFYGKKENWWGPAGKTGPCGPDTEMFYDATGKPCSSSCHPNDNCGRFFEIWNDVFMEYNKTAEGKHEPLKQKNVDTGMGVERTVAALNGLDDNYQTELFWPIIRKIEEISGKRYQENQREFRIIADHLRAAIFLIADGISPSNVERGYILRRLIRRAIRFGKTLQLIKVFTPDIANAVTQTMKGEYPELEKKSDFILETLSGEEEDFSRTLKKGIKALKKIFGRAIGGVDPENLPKGMIIQNNVIRVDGSEVFHVYETYGVPPELSQEIMTEWGLRFDDQTMRECNEAFKKHQEISRVGAEKKFAGGLADHSEEVTKLHTATHLLHQALRLVLGEDVRQSGSNITAERLRFDFTHSQRVTSEEIEKVEDLVNQKIKENLPVKMEVMSLDEAKKKGALAVFVDKYGEQVKVYSISDPSAGSGQVFSIEVCGGPHVNFTGSLGRFKIIKEEAAAAGVRRIYATLNPH